MIDVVFLAHNRLEFTKASFVALMENTDWSDARLIVYDDGSTDGTAEWLIDQVPVIQTQFGSPVSTMNHYLASGPSKLWAKVDSDTMVPPGWLNECLSVMNASPELELLGIEAMRPLGGGPRGYNQAPFIGGIGLFRASAWKTRVFAMEPNGRFGFTAWQDMYSVCCGWIDPALPVFLLDKMPTEPWASLSAEYVKRGWQRAWPKYTADQAELWGWWRP